MIPRNGEYGPGIGMAIPEEIWVEKMREKIRKMTDLVCSGRFTKLSERFLIEMSGFCSRNRYVYPMKK